MTWPVFYLVCFLIGFVFSVLSLLSGIAHLHLPRHFHLPHGVAGQHSGLHVGHAAAKGMARASTGQISFFNFFSMMAFLAWFGGTGYILTTYSSLWALAALAISTAAGFAGGAVVFVFFAKVLVAHERVLDPADYSLIGVLGRVSVSIREGGTGEIIFSQEGTRRTSGARSEDGQAIAHGAEVVVTRYERGIAYVRRWDDLAGDWEVRNTRAG